MSDSFNRNRRRTHKVGAVRAKRAVRSETFTGHSTYVVRRAHNTIHSATPASRTDQTWDAAFARSHDVLAQLAEEALADLAAGRTEPLDPDRL